LNKITLGEKFNLFYGIIVTIFPASLMLLAPVFTAVAPAEAEEFGTVFPVISYISLFSVFYIIFSITILKKNIYGINKVFYFYVIATIVSIVLMIIYQEVYYLDNIILLFNTLCIYLVWMMLKEPQRNIGLIISIFISCLITLAYYFANQNIVERINIPGFEITSTGYAIGVMIILSLEYCKKRYFAIIFIIGLLTMLLAGSRFPILILFFILFLILLQNQKTNYKILTCILILIIFYYGIDLIIGRRGDFEGYKILNFMDEIIDAINNYDPYTPIINDQLAKTNVIYGRIIGALSGVDVLKESFPMPLGSDWVIQLNLLERGFPSHSHSTLIQFFLKFGLFSLILYALILSVAKKLFINNDKKKWALLYLVISCFFDYILFVPNMLAIFLILCSQDSTKKIEN
jgi:hypothetical protein